jgi:hypothetical protein
MDEGHVVQQTATNLGDSGRQNTRKLILPVIYLEVLRKPLSSPGYSSGLAVQFDLPLVLFFYTSEQLSSIDIMTAQLQPPQPRQPDFTELAQCFEHAARQISRFPNIPAFNQGDIIITQLRNITQAIDDLRNEVGDMRARFDAR